jgi:hypothetical protein
VKEKREMRVVEVRREKGEREERVMEVREDKRLKRDGNEEKG